MGTYYTDSELGRLLLKRSIRCRRFTFRMIDGVLCASGPLFTTESEFRRVVNELRPRLRKLVEKDGVRRQKNVLLPDTSFGSDWYRLSWRKAQVHRIQVVCGVEGMEVVYAPELDLRDEEVQRWLQCQLERSLLSVAKRRLPLRLQELALRHGFKYNGVTVRRTHSSWGSCSSSHHLSLSAYLILLPEHLRDSVLLHELCHTVQMNHSPEFWSLLDSCLDGRSQKLRQELKEYTAQLFIHR